MVYRACCILVQVLVASFRCSFRELGRTVSWQCESVDINLIMLVGLRTEGEFPANSSCGPSRTGERDSQHYLALPNPPATTSHGVRTHESWEIGGNDMIPVYGGNTPLTPDDTANTRAKGGSPVPGRGPACTSAGPSSAPQVCIAVYSLLQQGGNGRVYEATVPDLGLVALKDILMPDQPSLEMELAASAVLDHPQIVRCFPPMYSPGRMYIPMELCEGDLLARVGQWGPLQVEVEAGRARKGLHAKSLARQLLSALLCCHSRGIYHGDVKPENVMLVGEVAKLGDFGSASLSPVRDALVGTLEFSPPEAIVIDSMSCPSGGAPRVLRHGLPPYDSAPADVWAFGLTMAVAVTDVHPWAGEFAHPVNPRYAHFLGSFSTTSSWSAAAAYKALYPSSHMLALAELLPCDDSGHSLPFPLLHFLCSALHPDPALRSTLDQLLAHPWLSSP